MRAISWGLLASAALLTSVPAVAETLRVSGVYPAGNDGAASLESIAVEQFGGEAGSYLSIQIEDTLRGANVDGEPWFRIVPGSLSSDADAALRGAVIVRSDRERSGEKEVTTCVERDAKKKCIRERKDKVPCSRTIVRVTPSLRLIGRDGELIHADDSTVERSERFCADQSVPDKQAMIDSALSEIAGRMRYAMAPVQRSEDVRVLESRKGMDKAAGKQFREAIKLTKRNENAACDAFAALEPSIGEHESLLFNLGLCAESIGDLDGAEAYYRRALAVDPGDNYASMGMGRVEERRRADRQLSQRYEG